MENKIRVLSLWERIVSVFNYHTVSVCNTQEVIYLYNTELDKNKRCEDHVENLRSQLGTDRDAHNKLIKEHYALKDEYSKLIKSTKSKNSRSLNCKQVKRILRDRSKGSGLRELSLKYGVSKTTISGIINNKVYRSCH